MSATQAVKVELNWHEWRCNSGASESQSYLIGMVYDVPYGRWIVARVVWELTRFCFYISFSDRYGNREVGGYRPTQSEAREEVERYLGVMLANEDC